MTDAESWPSRREIEDRWRAILDGTTTREVVHDWTVHWVEGSADVGSDPMILNALQSLHGFTMAYHPETPNLIHHGPPGTYVRSMQDIRLDYQRWLAGCAEHDADPKAFRASRLAVAQKYVEDERRRLEGERRFVPPNDHTSRP